MIVKKYIIIGMNQAISERDYFIYSSNSIQYIFDNEEKLLNYAKNKYYANPMQIALIEGEIYENNSCVKQLRDIKEICGFRKDLEQEINKLKELEFRQQIKII